LAVPIYIVSSNRNGLASYSRYVTDVFVLNSETADYVTKIENWIRKFVKNKPVLLVAGDDDALAILSKNHDYLKAFSDPAFPSWDVVSRVINKEQTYDLARTLNIPTIDTEKISSIDELKKLLESDRFEYPLFLKCTYSRQFSSKYRTKGVICTSKTDVLDAYKNYDGFLGSLLVQELIPGDIDRIFAVLLVLNKKSEVIAFFANEKIRAASLYGSTSLSRSTWDKVLIDQAITIAEEIGYVGFLGVQFKLDPRDGEYKLLEINGRFSVSVSLAIRCGVDMPKMVYDECSGSSFSRLTEFDRSYKTGVLLWYPLNDFALLMQKRFYKDPISYISSLRGSGYLIEPFSWRDPKPFLVALVQHVVNLVKKTVGSAKGILMRSSGSN
jgi:predicted ATP-grasp superfamily ATP-dependent carboligase